MSHFTVLVIGDNPEKQLAPYHEFESTNCIDEYVRDIDITDEILSEINSEHSLQDILDNYGLADKLVENENNVDLLDVHKFGYALVNYGCDSEEFNFPQCGHYLKSTPKLIKAVKRTNPNAKWDWYELGGRWSNFLLLKNGDHVDQARKCNIDFQKIKLDTTKKAKEAYSIFKKFMDEHRNKFPKTWNELRAEYNNIDIAREKYHSQPIIETIKKCDSLNSVIPWHQCPFDYFGKYENDFIKRNLDSMLVTYAIVKDGEWLARGEMGWFGYSLDDMTQEQWNEKYWEILNSLADDTLLSVYDCHI